MSTLEQIHPRRSVCESSRMRRGGQTKWRSLHPRHIILSAGLGDLKGGRRGGSTERQTRHRPGVDVFDSAKLNGAQCARFSRIKESDVRRKPMNTCPPIFRHIGGACRGINWCHNYWLVEWSGLFVKR